MTREKKRSMKSFEYDPRKGKFRSYLKTIVVRSIYRKNFQKQRSPALGDYVEDAADPGVDENVRKLWEEEWRRHHIRLAMRKIRIEFNERDREAWKGIPGPLEFMRNPWV